MEGSNYKILAYCCEHCAYAAADLAGGLRMRYPPSVKIVHLPCSGRVEPALLLKAFEEGADGILVAGWLPGDCHYLEGNANARRRIERIKQLLQEIGLEPDRVRMVNLSAAMATAFVEAVTDMAEHIQSLGPNPLRVGQLANLSSSSVEGKAW